MRPKLKELYLRDNHISDVSVLQNLTGLERLNLSNNNHHRYNAARQS